MKDEKNNGQFHETLTDQEFYERYLAGKDWQEETEEDRILNKKLRAELEEEVKQEEALQQAHPELEEIQAPPDLFDRILKEAKKKEREKEAEKRPAKENEKAEENRNEEDDSSREENRNKEINREENGKGETDRSIPEVYDPEAYLSEEDRKALEIGRKRLKRKKFHRWKTHFLANAAILVGVFLIGVSTEANRTKIVNVIHTLVGNEALVNVDNETDRKNYKKEEFEALAQIKEQLGIKPVRFMYELKGMEFDGYQIDENVEMAKLFYVYNDTIMTIIMRTEDEGTAKGDIPDGKIGDMFEVKSGIGNIEVVEVQGNIGTKYLSEFIYNNTYYYIWAEIPKEEFTNLMSSIFF